MKMKKGFAFVEFLCIFGIIVILLGVLLGFCLRHIVGNKQIIDFNQRFNVAYIRIDDNKWERINVKAWKDWDKSDSIQIIKTDGNAIYTHLCNVKLCKEQS